MGHAVSVAGVTKHYGAVAAIEEVSMEIDPGETVALLGPNGAGKTTLISLLLGLRRPDAGQLLLFDEEPTAAVKSGKVGAMMQSGTLPLDVTVTEVVELFRSLHPRRLPHREVLAAAGLTELADRRLDRLSGGQAQRVRFALAIAGDPDILFLDEPTVGMDLEARRAFWVTIRGWAASGRTVLLTTHHLSEMEAAADRVIVLRHGRVVADASPSALTSNAETKTLRFRAAGATVERMLSLPSVVDVSTQHLMVTLTTTDADATVAALFGAGLAIHDLDIIQAGLEDAVVALTSDDKGDR